MSIPRRLVVLLALIVMLATAIEYGLITLGPSQSVATGGTIISEN